MGVRMGARRLACRGAGWVRRAHRHEETNLAEDLLHAWRHVAHRVAGRAVAPVNGSTEVREPLGFVDRGTARRPERWWRGAAEESESWFGRFRGGHEHHRGGESSAGARAHGAAGWRCNQDAVESSLRGQQEVRTNLAIEAGEENAAASTDDRTQPTARLGGAVGKEEEK